MNKQQGPGILLINKMIPLGAERGQGRKRGGRPNNRQQHMTTIALAPLAQLDWTQISLKPIPRYKKNTNCYKTRA